MTDQSLRILVFGAHPDDCDIKAGGSAALYQQSGHTVKFVSVTNGESGHQRLSGTELAEIRRAEAAAAGKSLEIEYEVLTNRDGYLQPTIEARFEIIRLIRSFQPDLILTHRPNDYHPDHRYTSQLVCDAAYMVTVPPIVPDVPALRKNPVIAYLSDHFTRPYPFSPTVVVDVEPVWDRMIAALDCHQSQFYDWLPYNHFYEEEVPADPGQRKIFLSRKMKERIGPLADRYRELVIQTYGEKRGREIQLIEAFEPCEYGSPLTDENRKILFPFLP
ncbi:PIG-L family deacetylase [Gimesia sp.]|uniref:PIG-L deacetylase family protein n=1 Tax=Gimesia sp. TaxID=2024833 RepID=UPI000C6A07A3|nr:PIG-L family deacetylase [Gimesia sp.]MAX36603.1 GlcNAc-PI de-N-acetylase [Gimesia sp.]HBL45609.1 GlcNAc-PI de-N-acetylase [Planctomycetaceae bacterium]|tara:strand:+ start:4016 stop:4840 length:825 start_codon:yes stop_codon:yes gene_type:complete